MMMRREFLIGSALAANAVRMSGQSPDQVKLDRVSIMSLCFGRILKSTAYPDDANRTIDVLDLADIIAQRWGVHHLEMQHTHFRSTETGYLEEFRGRLKNAKTQMNQINLEFGPLNISTPDPVLRVETIDLTKKWIDHAMVLECPRVMVNQGTLAPEVRQSAIDTLKTINAYGKAKKVFVTMENRDDGPRRGGPEGAATAEGASTPLPPRPRSPSWEVVVEVIKGSGIWANPDVGHFPDEESRAAGLRAMYPLSSGGSHCHYDPERYNEANAIKISKEVGYKGLYSVETAAINGPDPYAAVQSILDELLRDL
jgi:hypothetical protein